MSTVDDDLFDRLGFILRRSRLSFLTTIMTITIVAAVIVAASSEIGRLSSQIGNLNSEKTTLEREIARDKSAEARLARKVEQYRHGLRVIVEANRDLMSHRYDRAIEEYQMLKETYGDSPETLNAYGYARLRWAIALKQQSETAEDPQKSQLIDQARDQFSQATQLFDQAAAADPSYNVPIYLAVLSTYYAGRTGEALTRTSTMLEKFPSLLNMLCSDGQIKQAALDKDALRRLAEIAQPHVAVLDGSKCFFLH
ncbi:MAG TPA: hypothetical protein VN682_20450 [Terriglobales bacterium]|nr:hypothetical protein [Terriglobales bacterium]